MIKVKQRLQNGHDTIQSSNHEFVHRVSMRMINMTRGKKEKGVKKKEKKTSSGSSRCGA